MASAGGATIGALRAILGIDTVQFEKGLKDAQSSLGQFAKASAAVAAGIGIEKAVERAAHAFTDLIKHGFKTADEMGKLSQKIGVPVEGLSALAHAADLSGVNLDQLGTGVGKLSKVMGESMAGAVNDSTRALAKYTEVRDAETGKVRPTIDVLLDLSEKFKGLNDNSQKTALAMQLFGKSGKDMIPLLNEGRDKIKEMMEEAQKLGLVFSKETVAATTHFNDDMRTLNKVAQGVANLLTAEFAPALAVLVERMKDAVINGDLVRKIADAITSAITSTIMVVARIGLTFTRMGEEIAGVIQGLKGLATFDPKMADAGFQRVADATTNYHASIAALDAGIKKFLADAAAKAVQWAGEMKKGNVDAATGTERHKDELEQFINSQNKAILKQQSMTATLGAAIGERERITVVEEAYRLAAEKEIPLNAAREASIAKLGERARFAAIQLAGAQLTQESLLPWEQHAQQLAKIQQLYEAGAISATTYEKAMREAAVKSGTAWDVAGASIAGSFATIAGSFGKENKAMATAAKAFAIVQATISVFTGMAKALELPFPANLAAAAAVAAQGFAFVANIKSQAVPKFQQGGSFQVPGGIGGGDRVFTPLMLEPGERVDVTSNRDQLTGRQVNVSMTGKFFDRDTVMEMVQGINDALGDGVQIKFAPA